MHLALLTALIIGRVAALTTAFQSIVTPTFSSPFSTYSFNVINSASGQTQGTQTFYNPMSGNRIAYIQPPSFSYREVGIQQIFALFPGYSSIPTITLLKNYGRAYNGAGNNLLHPTYNQAGTGLARHSPALYKDGKEAPISSNFSPREISNALGPISQKLIPEPNNVTTAFVIWGQFIDHDVGLTEVNDQEPMPITIPKCDPFMDTECSGEKVIPFKRSLFMANVTVRDQMNSITGWLDASQVYGSSSEVGDRLRTRQMGKMREGEHLMLPLLKDNKFGMNDAGDIRANENLLLTSYHTIFVREHNRMAKVIASKDPLLTDTEIYTAARNYVTALVQKITMEDFLPILIGKQMYDQYIGKYPGYDNKTDPTVEIEFTTAAFRVGHSLLVPKYPLIDRYGAVTDEFSLNDMFFRPDLLDSTTMEKLIRGLAKTQAKKKDGTLINQIRNLLITDPAKRHINMDLYSLNIQRARDHGLQKFNYMRMSYGFPPLKSFFELTGDVERAKIMEDFYKDINNVDPWVGILSQKSVQGGILGEVGAKIVGTNFNRIRNCDRFWYEKDYPASIVKEIKATKLSEIMIRNTGILELQEDIFHISP